MFLAVAAALVLWVDMTEFTAWQRAYAPTRLALGLVPYVALRSIYWRQEVRHWAPAPSAGFWAKSVGLILAVSMVLAIPFWAYMSSAEGSLPPSQVRMQGLAHYASFALVKAPIIEEAVYRGAVCFALWIAVGPWPAILISGAAFTWLHVLYGTFAPNHVVAGLILSWGFVRSGRLWVAIVLHSLGNVLAGAGDLFFLD